MHASLKDNLWNLAAFAWGVAEATFFFLVPDVILSFIGLRRGYRAAAIASVWSAVGAALGGAAMYLWSASQPAAAQDFVLAVPAISDAMLARAHDAMLTQGWFVATLIGPLSATPYKVYAVLAPHIGANLALFALASVIARIPRFLIVSFGVTLIGGWLKQRLSARAVDFVLLASWIAFYTVFFLRTPG